MFALSKILGPLTEPGNLIFFLLVVGVVGHWLAWRKIGVAAWGLAMAGMIVIATIPLGTWALTLLEERFPQPELGERVDGIVVLGGMVDPVLSEKRGQDIVGGSFERLLVVPELMRRYPDAKIIFSGGSGLLTNQQSKEAVVARNVLATMGVDTTRVIFEDQSRNTVENAIYSQEAAQPQPGETWLLVTSAAHIPRAVGAFRRLGWEVLPYPVDYTTSGDMNFSPPGFSAGLGRLNAALHELRGLVFYRINGWTAELFPGPDANR